MGVWDGQPTTTQYQPSARGLDALFARIELLEKLVAQLTGANILSPAGLKVSGEGLDVASNLVVSGNMVVDGTLSLPAGIIGNDALTNPVSYASARGSANNFAVPTGLSSVAPATITVPAGFTSGIIFAFVTAGAVNSSAAYDFLFVKARTNGVDSDTMPYPGSASGGWAAGPMSDIEVLSGLTGGQNIPVSCVINAQSAAWSANASNRAFTRALGFFFR